MLKKKFLFITLFVFSALNVFAATKAFDIPESAEIRKNLAETWFDASLTTVRFNQPQIFYNKIGEEFQVRLEETDTTFNIFVSPLRKIKVDYYSDTGFYTKEEDSYPGDAPGSWVLVRNKKDGSPIRIRYYFLQDSDVFIQFSPTGKTSTCDLVIFGNYAVRGAPTGVGFKKFYDASFSEVQKITEKNVPWNYVSSESGFYHSVLQMAQVIREKLPEIQYKDDVMIDENGNFVSVSSGKTILPENDKKTLSSAGFLKWIADGLVEPIAGGKLNRMPLLMQTVEYKETGHLGVLEQNYSLSFALDFVRNLSSAVLSVMTGNTYLYNQSGADVTVIPFSAVLTEKGIASNVTFIEDTGYNANVLKSLLYVLAATEPGNIFFGALRQTAYSSPEVKVFNNCAAFMPFFETNGAFNCYVFMNGEELSLDDFIATYSDAYVYLTRVRSSEEFFPD